jgi:hypothetical protein
VDLGEVVPVRLLDELAVVGQNPIDLIEELLLLRLRAPGRPAEGGIDGGESAVDLGGEVLEVAPVLGDRLPGNPADAGEILRLALQFLGHHPRQRRRPRREHRKVFAGHGNAS